MFYFVLEFNLCSNFNCICFVWILILWIMLWKLFCGFWRRIILFLMGYGGMYFGFELSVWILVNMLILEFWYCFVIWIVGGNIDLSLKWFILLFNFLSVLCWGSICGLGVLRILGDLVMVGNCEGMIGVVVVEV